jgi:osmotically inducible protein OsmC
MPVRTANARWEGSITEGSGRMRLGSGAFEGAYSFSSRMQDEPGTNPEELIGAAHAGCFSMALAAALSRNGTPPTSIETSAKVTFEQLEAGWTITNVTLSTVGNVPGLDATQFRELAEGAKANCPVSRALQGVEITLEAELA